MGTSQQPDGADAQQFAHDLAPLVRQLDRLITSPPRLRGPELAVRFVPGPSDGQQHGGAAQLERASAFVELMHRRLHDGGGRSLVPHAVLRHETTDEHERSLPSQVRRRLADTMPPGTGRLRWRQYRLMRALTESTPAEPDGETEPDTEDAAVALRKAVYARFAEHSPLGRLLGWAAQPDHVDTGVWWQKLLQPLFGQLPRAVYWRFVSRRMNRRRGWYRHWSENHGDQDLFTSAVQTRLAGAAHADGHRRHLAEQALLRAALADLRTGLRFRILSPWRRRRRVRFVLLAPPSERESEQRLVRDLPDAVHQTGCRAVLVLGAEPRPERRPHHQHGQHGQHRQHRPESVESATLPDAVRELRAWPKRRRVPGDAGGADGADGLHLTIDAAALPPLGGTGGTGGATETDGTDPLRRQLPRLPVRLPSRRAARAEAAAQAAAVLAVLSLLSWQLVPVVRDALDDSCAGGAPRSPVRSTPASDARADLLFQQEERRIARQNARARQARSQGAQVRTVVHLTASVPAGTRTGETTDGTLPEERGVSLAQKEANDEAAQDSKKTWLKVRTVEAGPGFVHGAKAARKIVGWTRRSGDDIAGVIGPGQSRKGAEEAVDILGKAGVPVIGTSATADAMLAITKQYVQVAPKNQREGAVAADFLRRARSVQTGGRGAGTSCAAASSALLVQDPVDPYSKSLGDDFAHPYERAGGRVYTVWYHPGGDVDEPSAENDPDVEWAHTLEETAGSVCDRLRKEPRLAVYWAARAKEFVGFLNSYAERTGCGGRRLTVVGGDDLSNAATTSQNITLGRPWLRLYYAAHAAPDGAHSIAARYAGLYRSRYGAHDPWRRDGHAALAWDAFSVLAGAVNEAYQGSAHGGFGRDSVLIELRHGVGGKGGIQGVTGALDFSGQAEVPPDKPVLIRYADGTATGGTALTCGILRPGGDPGHWGPHGRYACPRDR